MRAARDPLKSVTTLAATPVRWPSPEPVWDLEGVIRYASTRRIRLVAYGARLERGLG